MQFVDDVMVDIIPARIEQFKAGYTKVNNICLHNRSSKFSISEATFLSGHLNSTNIHLTAHQSRSNQGNMGGEYSFMLRVLNKLHKMLNTVVVMMFLSP